MAGASAKGRPSSLTKKLVTGIVLAWIAVAGWHQFVGFSLPYHLRASQLQKKYDRCGGSFSGRYNCRSGIRISAGRETFYLWTSKFLVVFLPPILLGLGYNAIRRRKWRQAEAMRRKRLAPKKPPRAAPNAEKAATPWNGLKWKE